METIRVGVIGAGGKARQHMGFMSAFEEVEFAALCDPLEEERTITGEKFQIGARFADIDEMLESTELDAAVVSTPPELNAPAARTCLERGIHTLLEKPPGMTVGETRELRDTAARTGARGMVGFNRRFHDQICRAREMVTQRGPVVQLVGEFHKSIDMLEGRYGSRPALMDNWLVANDIHAIDLVRCIADAEVEEVHSFARRAFSKYCDLHGALVVFSNQCVAHFIFNYTTDSRMERYEIHGRGISAYLEGVKQGVVFCDGERHELPEPDDGLGGTRGEDHHFIRCLLEDRPIEAPAPNLDEAVKTMELAEAIRGGLREE